MRETRREMVIPQSVRDQMARAVAGAPKQGEARTVLRDVQRWVDDDCPVVRWQVLRDRAAAALARAPMAVDSEAGEGSPVWARQLLAERYAAKVAAAVLDACKPGGAA